MATKNFQDRMSKKKKAAAGVGLGLPIAAILGWLLTAYTDIDLPQPVINAISDILNTIIEGIQN